MYFWLSDWSLWNDFFSLISRMPSLSELIMLISTSEEGCFPVTLLMIYWGWGKPGPQEVGFECLLKKMILKVLLLRMMSLPRLMKLLMLEEDLKHEPPESLILLIDTWHCSFAEARTSEQDLWATSDHKNSPDSWHLIHEQPLWTSWVALHWTAPWWSNGWSSSSYWTINEADNVRACDDILAQPQTEWHVSENTLSEMNNGWFLRLIEHVLVWCSAIRSDEVNLLLDLNEFRDDVLVQIWWIWLDHTGSFVDCTEDWPE